MTNHEYIIAFIPADSEGPAHWRLLAIERVLTQEQAQSVMKIIAETQPFLMRN
jgi:hypothetical protein